MIMAWGILTGALVIAIQTLTGKILFDKGHSNGWDEGEAAMKADIKAHRESLDKT